MDPLKQQIRELMVTELMLPMSPEEISDDAIIFSPQGLALDSVDALQLVVALEKKFGLKLPDADSARTILHSIDTIAEAIKSIEAGSSPS
jgi:acyl carrier protein